MGRWIAVGRQFSHLHIGTLARWYVGTLARWHVVTSAHRFVNHPYPFLRSRGIQFAHSHEQMYPTVRLLRPACGGPRNDGRVGGGFYASLPLIDSSNATAVICNTPTPLPPLKWKPVRRNFICTSAHRPIGTLAHWHVGTLAHWYLGTLTHRPRFQP